MTNADNAAQLTRTRESFREIHYMQLVIVESPAKAKTIEKYLGSDYRVLASYGHIRDLAPKDGSVDPDNDFDMVDPEPEPGEPARMPP